MYAASGNGYNHGFGYGFGAVATLVLGRDFKCTDKICYGIGAANHALFQQLQQALNRLAGPNGFAPLIVDGFIGPSTVAAVAKIPLSSAGLAAALTKEQIAAQAPSLIETFNKIAPGGSSMGPVHSMSTSTSAQAIPMAPAPTTATAPTTSAVTLPATKKKNSTTYLILGGLTAVLVVGGISYVVYRRKAQQGVRHR